VTARLCVYRAPPEAFGISYVEALAVGRPIIGCRGEGPAFLIEEGRHGWLVHPGDHQQIAEHLCWAATNQKQLKAIGREGAGLVRRRHTWTASARRMLEIYRQEAS